MKEHRNQGINLTGDLILPVNIWLTDHMFTPWVSQEAQQLLLTLRPWLPRFPGVLSWCCFLKPTPQPVAGTSYALGRVPFQPEGPSQVRLGRSRDTGGEERCKQPLLLPCLTSRSDLTCCLLSGLVSLSILVIPACPCREVLCFQIAFPWCISLLPSCFHPVTIPACSSEGRAQLRDTGQGAKGSSI